MYSEYILYILFHRVRAHVYKMYNQINLHFIFSCRVENTIFYYLSNNKFSETRENKIIFKKETIYTQTGELRQALTPFQDHYYARKCRENY